jgi:hypothetical protein
VGRAPLVGESRRVLLLICGFFLFLVFITLNLLTYAGIGPCCPPNCTLPSFFSICAFPLNSAEYSGPEKGGAQIPRVGQQKRLEEVHKEQRRIGNDPRSKPLFTRGRVVDL